VHAVWAAAGSRSTFERHLPLRLPSNLAEPDLARRILTMAGGLISGIATIRVCRDFRAGEMSGLLSRVGAAISVLMEVKLRWEPGPGIRVVDAEFRGERWIVKAEASGDARCPGCSLQATRRHSFYMRRLQDLPVQGTIVELQVSMTRWRCCNRSRCACGVDVRSKAPGLGRVAGWG
jgi:hypothetical protein